MSYIKTALFEEINEREDTSILDVDYRFEEWKEEHLLEEESQKASFMQIFESTNTYPM